MTSTWEDFERELADIDVDAIVAQEGRPSSGDDMMAKLGLPTMAEAAEKAGLPATPDEIRVLGEVIPLDASDDVFEHMIGEAYLIAEERLKMIQAVPEADWDNPELAAQHYKMVVILNGIGLMISVETAKRRLHKEHGGTPPDDVLQTWAQECMMVSMRLATGELVTSWQFKRDDEGNLDAVHAYRDNTTGQCYKW